LTFDDVRTIALALPGVTEGTSYGTPGLHVRKKLLARLKEDGVTLVLRVNLDEKEHLMEASPDAFFETDHYKGWPAVLVRLPVVDEQVLKVLLIRYWRSLASKTQVRAFDALHG
jgi:hypothetical protein